MVNLKINGKNVCVPEGTTILEAARSIGINIPTLCYLKGVNQIGACRMCVVEIKGTKKLVASCVQPVSEGMEVETSNPKIINSRKTTLELLLSMHDKRCLSCVRNQKCELQRLCSELGVDDEMKYQGARPKYKKDESTSYLIRDDGKCILCKRCVAACKNQHVAVIGTNNRGFDTQIGCAFDKDLKDVPCIACGQCIAVCPTGALRERDNGDDVMEAINNPNKVVIVNTAPSIRVTLGEEFGFPIGTNVKGKMVSALRMLGFDKVFDTDFGADLTIMEEANEFIERVKTGGPFPLITSCSPAWIKFCEHYYPEFIKNLSSCKSPQQMTGAIIKTWYAEKNGLSPRDIVVVGIMPCIAKKFEIRREDESTDGYLNTDIVITTRELARLIKRAGIDFKSLPDEDFDPVLGVSTGAGAIFGASGGVMEAALRTASDILTGTDTKDVKYNEIRGTNGLKEATYKIGDLTINVAVASGMNNASKLLEKIKKGEKEYHFIEIMGCPGGCINGGGQPILPDEIKNFTDVKAKRSQGLYEEDEKLKIRKSHENPVVNMLYKEFLGKPGSQKAHEILHTSYKKRAKY